MELGLTLEVAGCPTVCMHCWAQGIPYNAMPLEDIRWVLEQTRQFCAGTGLELSAFPMHEVAAHPRAPEVLRLFREITGSDPGFEPLATTGVPIALRDDWDTFLTAIGATGTNTFWVAFHGYAEEHDCLVNRAGASQETCLAVRRIRSLGFRCGANVFVTKEMVAKFEGMVETLQAIGLNEMSWDPARFHPTARSRRYEAHRPERNDLLPIAEKIKNLSGFWKEKWGNLEAYTEGAWRQRALEGDWPAPWEHPPSIGLVCRPNFDLVSGEAGHYGRRHGNLKQDGVGTTLQQAVAYGPSSKDALTLRTATIPSITELAERYGDARWQAIHFDAESARNLWLDRAGFYKKA